MEVAFKSLNYDSMVLSFYSQILFTSIFLFILNVNLLGIESCIFFIFFIIFFYRIFKYNDRIKVVQVCDEFCRRR